MCWREAWCSRSPGGATRSVAATRCTSSVTSRTTGPTRRRRAPGRCGWRCGTPRNGRQALVSGPVAVELLVVLIEDPLLQLVADRRPVDLPVLSPEVAPRLVGGEQDPVFADSA